MTQATILKDVNILKIKAIVGAQNSPKSSGAKLLYYTKNTNPSQKKWLNFGKLRT